MNDLRSRIFWSAYEIERMNGLILGRPFSISDVDIDVPVPKRTLKTEIAYQIVMLRQIQSRISSFIYKPPRLTGTPKELETTRRQIMYELNEWLQNFPAKEKTNCPFETDNWPTISYHNSVTVLLRPVVLEVSKLGIDSSPDCVRWFNIFFESASTICLSYKKLYLKRMLRYMWLTVHCCFVAGFISLLRVAKQELSYFEASRKKSDL